MLTCLQRHILVKGCGNGNPSDAGKDDGVKSDSGSDGNNDSSNGTLGV
jgi:hypothetical protein